MRNKFYIVFLILLIAACSNTETIIRDKKIEITVPGIKDTIPGSFEEFPKAQLDSLKIFFSHLPDSATIKGTFKLPKTDIPGNVEYKPSTNEFIIDIPPQKADTTMPDTLKTVIKDETTLAEKLGYGLIGAVVLGLIVLAIKLKIFR